MKQIIYTSKAPEPIGPYSQAVALGNLLFVSGQIPFDVPSNTLELGSIEAQTKVVMENLKAILESHSMSFDHVLKTTIFLMDMNDFAQVNAVYGSYFTKDFPARETVQVAGLPKGVSVEISVIASKF